MSSNFLIKAEIFIIESKKHLRLFSSKLKINFLKFKINKHYFLLDLKIN